MLTVLAGISTAIDGLIAISIRKTKFCYLCIAFGFSAGIMVFISFDELLPYVYRQRESQNQHFSMLGLFLGMFVIAMTLLVL